jgi:hypothetical protein
MRFQVVLRWPAHSFDDYDEMLGVEELLIAELTAESEVDGHDFGGRGTNIFVATDDPNLRNYLYTPLSARSRYYRAMMKRVLIVDDKVYVRGCPSRLFIL